jgi:hypothetical protein
MRQLRKDKTIPALINACLDYQTTSHYHIKKDKRYQ